VQHLSFDELDVERNKRWPPNLGGPSVSPAEAGHYTELKSVLA
jgi:hypothetical protein